MNREEILETVTRKNIMFVKLMFVDILGDLKTVEISTKELNRALDNKIMIDGSSVKGFATVINSDMSLAPDLDSFRVLPYFGNERWGVAMFMCDIIDSSGKPCPGCTRSNLKRILENMRELDFMNMNVGFEPEFYIFKTKPDMNNLPESNYLDFGGYCDDENSDGTAELRREMMYELERIGIDCATSHHECGPSQYEVTYRFGSALGSCDNILLFKYLVTAIAKRHGLYVTFMPKPIEGMAGSGLHTNVSLTNSSNENVFWDSDKKELSKIARSFITGVLMHAKGLCFLTNPTENSYRRLVNNFEAPVNVCWSMSNRSAMIRVPLAEGNSARAEVRSVDSSSNPYLAISGILAAGLEGIKTNAKQIEEVGRNVYNLSSTQKKQLNLENLPQSLQEALEEFKKDKVIQASVTEKIAQSLIKITGL